MGMVLGFLTYKSQSLWPAILGHFLNNLSGIFIFYQFNGKLTPPEDHWMSSPFWWGLSALMLLGWCWGVNKLISPKIPNSPREPS
jgi:membrane protease YdiL (CAAX protease family)